MSKNPKFSKYDSQSDEDSFDRQLSKQFEVDSDNYQQQLRNIGKRTGKVFDPRKFQKDQDGYIDFELGHNSFTNDSQELIADDNSDSSDDRFKHQKRQQIRNSRQIRHNKQQKNKDRKRVHRRQLSQQLKQRHPLSDDEDDDTNFKQFYVSAVDQVTQYSQQSRNSRQINNNYRYSSGQFSDQQILSRQQKQRRATKKFKQQNIYQQQRRQSKKQQDFNCNPQLQRQRQRPYYHERQSRANSKRNSTGQQNKKDKNLQNQNRRSSQNIRQKSAGNQNYSRNNLQNANQLILKKGNRQESGNRMGLYKQNRDQRGQISEYDRKNHNSKILQQKLTKISIHSKYNQGFRQSFGRNSKNAQATRQDYVQKNRQNNGQKYRYNNEQRNGKYFEQENRKYREQENRQKNGSKNRQNPNLAYRQNNGSRNRQIDDIRKRQIDNQQIIKYGDGNNAGIKRIQETNNHKQDKNIANKKRKEYRQHLNEEQFRNNQQNQQKRQADKDKMQHQLNSKQQIRKSNNQFQVNKQRFKPNQNQRLNISRIQKERLWYEKGILQGIIKSSQRIKQQIQKNHKQQAETQINSTKLIKKTIPNQKNTQQKHLQNPTFDLSQIKPNTMSDQLINDQSQIPANVSNQQILNIVDFLTSAFESNAQTGELNRAIIADSKSNDNVFMKNKNDLIRYSSANKNKQPEHITDKSKQQNIKRQSIKESRNSVQLYGQISRQSLFLTESLRKGSIEYYDLSQYNQAQQKKQQKKQKVAQKPNNDKILQKSKQKNEKQQLLDKNATQQQSNTNTNANQLQGKRNRQFQQISTKDILDHDKIQQMKELKQAQKRKKIKIHKKQVVVPKTRSNKPQPIKQDKKKNQITAQNRRSSQRIERMNTQNRTISNHKSKEKSKTKANKQNPNSLDNNRNKSKVKSQSRDKRRSGDKNKSIGKNNQINKKQLRSPDYSQVYYQPNAYLQKQQFYQSKRKQKLLPAEQKIKRQTLTNRQIWQADRQQKRKQRPKRVSPPYRDKNKDQNQNQQKRPARSKSRKSQQKLETSQSKIKVNISKPSKPKRQQAQYKGKEPSNRYQANKPIIRQQNIINKKTSQKQLIIKQNRLFNYLGVKNNTSINNDSYQNTQNKYNLRKRKKPLQYWKGERWIYDFTGQIIGVVSPQVYRLIGFIQQRFKGTIDIKDTVSQGSKKQYLIQKITVYQGQILQFYGFDQRYECLVIRCPQQIPSKVYKKHVQIYDGAQARTLVQYQNEQAVIEPNSGQFSVAYLGNKAAYLEFVLIKGQKYSQYQI